MEEGPTDAGAPEEGARTGRRRFRQSLPRPPQAVRLARPAARFPGLLPPEVAAAVEPGRIEAALARLADHGEVAEGSSRAAVLLALGWESDGSSPRLLLIRRAQHLRANPGEIAFPGGLIEPGESVFEAALREAEEEVGLDRGAVRIIGRLPATSRRSRRGEIAPVVGLVEGAPALRLSEAEVEESFLVELGELFDPASYWEEEWAPGEEEAWPMHFFDRGEDVIWGASARILVSFLEALAAEERAGSAGDRTS